MNQTNRPIISHNLVYDELVRRGYRAQNFELKKHFTLYTAPNGKTWLSQNTRLAYPFVTSTIDKVGYDKEISHEFAQSLGIDPPNTLVLPDESDQLPDFLATYAPIVIKPLASFGSRGLTMNIISSSQLETAIGKASEFSEKVLAQQQFSGQELRITVSNNKVVAIILRQTPQVRGDGTLSVAELIAADNITRKTLQFEYIQYPQLTADIIPAHWLTDASVPAPGEVVQLSQSTMVKTGASLYNVTDTVHESYKTMAIKLANTLNPNFLIIDLLVKDFVQPMTSENCVFLEFTTSPALKMYYGMRGGGQFDIVSLVADMIDEYCGVKTARRLSE